MFQLQIDYIITMFYISQKVNSTVESVIAEDTVSGAISLKEKMDHIVKENMKKKTGAETEGGKSGTVLCRPKGPTEKHKDPAEEGGQA